MYIWVCVCASIYYLYTINDNDMFDYIFLTRSTKPSGFRCSLLHRTSAPLGDGSLLVGHGTLKEGSTQHPVRNQQKRKWKHTWESHEPSLFQSIYATKPPSLCWPKSVDSSITQWKPWVPKLLIFRLCKRDASKRALTPDCWPLDRFHPQNNGISMISALRGFFSGNRCIKFSMVEPPPGTPPEVLAMHLGAKTYNILQRNIRKQISTLW